MALTFNELFIADPADPDFPHEPVAIEIDLNETEREGCDTGWSIANGEVDIQMTPISNSLHAPGYQGDAQASFDFGNSFMRFKLSYKNEEPAAVRVRLAALAKALQRKTGVIAQAYKGETVLYYYDYVKSNIPQMLHGQRRGLWRISEALLGEGIDVVIEVKPHPRLARVIGGPETFGTSPTTRALIVNNPGDFPSEMQVNIQPDQATSSVGQVLMGIRDRDNLAEWATLVAAAMSAMDPGVDTALDTSVSGAQNTDALVTDFTTNEDMQRRVREVVTFSTEALEGTHRYILRYKITGGSGTDNGLHGLQLRVGFSTDDVVPQAKDIIGQDWSNVGAAPGFTEVDLGLFTVPKGATTMVLEIWASREDGDTSLAFDMRTLVPADYWAAYVSPPGWRMGVWGAEEFEADVLEGTGALVRATYRLNAEDEVGRLRPGGGRELAAGFHAFEFRGSVREPSLAKTLVGMMEVEEKPADVVVAELKMKSRVGQLFTVWKKDKALHWTVSPAEAAANTYVMRVRQEAVTLTGRRIQIGRLIHSFIRGVTDDMNLIVDSFQRRAVAEVAAIPQFDLVLENDPPMAPSGDFGLVIIAGYLPEDAGYKDIDERSPLARSIDDATTTVSVDLWPRVH